MAEGELERLLVVEIIAVALGSPGSTHKIFGIYINKMLILYEKMIQILLRTEYLIFNEFNKS